IDIEDKPVWVSWDGGADPALSVEEMEWEYPVVSWDGSADPTMDVEWEEAKPVFPQMKFGKNAGGVGRSGLKLNDYNYDYTNGEFRRGDANWYIKRNHVGNMSIRMREFLLKTEDDDLVLDSHNKRIRLAD